MPAIFLLRVEPQTGQVSSQTKLRVPEGVSGFSAALIQRPEALQNLPPGLVITVPHDNGVVLFEGEDMVFQRNRMAYVHYENVLDSSGRGWLYGSWKRLLVFGRSNSRDLQPTVAAAIELDNDLYIFTGMHTDEAASLGSTNLAIIGPDSRAMEVAPAVLQNLDKISEYRNVKELSDLTAEHLQEKKRELSRLKRNINGGEAQLKRLINDFEALVRHFHGSASIDPEAVYNIIKNRSKKIDDLSDLVSDPAAESLRAALRVLPDEQVESKLGMSGREFIRTVVSVADQLREDYNDLPNLQQQVTQIEDRLNDLQNKANELIGKELVERYREWREGVTFVDGIVPGTACAAMYYHPESPTVGIFGLHLIYESVASSSGAKVGIFKAPENPDLNLRQIFDDGSWRSKLRHYDYPSVRDTKVKYVATCFNPNAGGGRRLIVYHAEGSSHYSGPILQAVASDLPLSTGQSWIVGPRVPSPPPGTKLKLPWKGIVDGVFPVGTWFHADLEREWLDNVIRHNHRSPFDGAFFLRSNVVYLWESYYFLPMQIGLQLCRAGQYEAGLEWFKRVYNYTLAPDQRKIFPRLRWEERYPDISNSTSGWGGRVFNPHVVAASRRAAYTQFTLFAIIRCLLNYGDEEFAQDTGASVQRARALYEMALDLLQTEELKKLRHPCATLTVDIKEKIYGYVGAEDDYDGIGRFFGESINHINQPEQLRKIKKALEELDLQGESRSERINRVRAAVQAIDAEGTTRPAVGKALENDATATKALSDQLLAQENIAGAASQIASQALSLDGVADERNRRARDLSWQTVSLSFCIPPNPVLQSLRQRSELNLEKIRSCRNIAGMKRELAPYAAPIGLKGSASSSISYAAARQANIQPTDYRYDTLIARAKELVNLAQKIEASLLSALVRRDKEAYSLLQARQDMGLAEAGVRLQTLRVRETQQRIVKAELQRERAYIQADRYEQWQRMGMNAYEKRMFKAYRKAAEKSQAAADWGVASSVVQGASSGAGLAAGLGASAAGPIGLAALGGAVVLGGLTLGQSRHRREAIEARRRAEAASVQASHARRMDRWRLQQQVAEQTRRIAAQQIDIIQAHLGVVEHQREISELELEHNQQTLEFLQDEQFTTAELFDWMADVLEGVYRYFLQQATSMAKLAEQQLSFERQEMPQQFIQSGYWRVNRKGQTEVSHDEETPDRRGLTGSARLLQDIP